MPQFKLSNAAKHFGTITEHKNEVCKGCFIAGLYWQGIIHDLSKFSLIEFIPSVKYYTGTSSPITAEKRILDIVLHGYTIVGEIRIIGNTGLTS